MTIVLFIAYMLCGSVVILFLCSVYCIHVVWLSSNTIFVFIAQMPHGSEMIIVLFITQVMCDSKVIIVLFIAQMPHGSEVIIVLFITQVMCDSKVIIVLLIVLVFVAQVLHGSDESEVTIVLFIA